MVTGWRNEHGNTLMLFPAALLVMVGLGGLVLDAALVLAAQRQLADVAAAVAHDAVSALDVDTYYRQGVIEIDVPSAQARTAWHAARVEAEGVVERADCAIEAAGPVATAHCVAQVRPRFVPRWPGSGREVTLRAVESARAAER